MPIPRLFTLAWLLPLALLGLAACGPQEQAPIRLGTGTWPGYEPLYLAEARGDLPDTDVRLVAYPSSTEVIRALRNRSLEAAALTLDEVLLLLADGVPLKVLLVLDVSNGGDVVLARPGIRKLKDLRGKRVGVESTALGAYMLTRSLQQAGLGIGDVTVHHLDVNTHEQAYLRGDVDAVVTFEPVRTRLLNAGARELFSTRQLPGEIIDVLVAHESVLAARPQAFRRLVEAWFRNIAFLHEDPDEASRIIARRLKITPPEVLASYRGLTLPDPADNRRLLGGDPPPLQATARRLAQVLLDAALLPRPVDSAGLFTTAALPPGADR